MSNKATRAIRPVTSEDDLVAFGRIVADSYMALPGHPPEPGYEAELADVASRIRTNIVFGAFDGPEPLGCVTYVDKHTDPHAENLQPGEASFRMLGVARAFQGRGVGAALVQRCLDTARDRGRSGLFIYSGEWMDTAHKLYDRLGFVRVPQRDWRFDDPPITLLGYLHEL